MKNTLWFLFKPADERETLIYKNAYERALSVLVLCFGLMLYSSRVVILLLGRNWDTMDFYSITTMFLSASLILAYLAGWSAVRKEDLSLTPTPRPHVKTWLFISLIALVMLTVVGIFLVSIISGWMTLFSLQSLFLYCALGIHLVLIAWAWKMTPEVPTAIRMVLCVLLSPAMVVLGYWKKKNLATLIAAYLVAIVAIGGLALTVVIALRIFVYTPIYLSTDDFEPEFHKGQYMIVTKIWTNQLAINDLVVYTDENGKRKVGLVMGSDWNTLLIGDDAGAHTINRSQVIGEALRD